MTDLSDIAHTRRHDPGTSYAAADAVTPNLRELQARVEGYARRRGPDGFTDAELSSDLDDPGSTYRTRRAELVARNIVFDSGVRRRFGDSPRKRIVWVHRDFVPGAPAICDPAGKVSRDDRETALQMASEMTGPIAARLRDGGNFNLARRIAECADMMRRLVR